MTRKKYISGYLKSAVLTAAMLTLSLAAVSQTTTEIAYGSPYGIFVITGNEVNISERNSEKGAGYLIERKKIKDGQWRSLATVTAPGKMKDFESSLKYWCDIFPEWADFNRIPAGKLFTILQRTGTIDSLKFYAQLLPVRLAAGATYLDSTMSDTLKYQYRVSKTIAAAPARVLYLSNPASKEETTYLGNPVIIKKLVSADEVIITSILDPGYRPSFYRVFRKKEGEKSFSQINPAIVRYIKNDTAFVTVRDTEIERGKVFNYYITPVDYYGRVSVSSDIVRTGIYSFSSVNAPYNIRTDAIVPVGGIRITWSFDEPEVIRSLNLYRSADYDNGYILISKISPKDSVFKDAAVEPARKYFYYFVMEGFFNELSPAGVRFSGSAGNMIPPLRPMIAKAEGVIDGAKIEVKCFNPDIKSVWLYRRIKSGGEFAQVAVIPATAGESVVYSDTSRYFTGYTLLSYTAKAENTSFALSPLSDTVSVYPVSEMGPVSPDEISVTIENGRVNLLWDDICSTNPEITGCRVYRRIAEKTARQASFALLYDGFLKPDVNYFTDTLVTEGKTYEYQVRGVDFKGTESVTGPVTTVIFPKARPAAPSGLKLLSQSEGIIIEWEEPEHSGIKSYNIYRYERGGKPVVVTIHRGTTQFIDTTAQKGKLYFYYLTTLHENGTESVPGPEEGIWR